MLSYGNDFTNENNPLECGLEKYCSFDNALQHIGKKALAHVKLTGPPQQIRSIRFDGEKCPPCASTWPLKVADTQVGHISTAIWSPRFKCNISLGMIKQDYWDQGQAVEVNCADGTIRNGEVLLLS